MIFQYNNLADNKKFLLTEEYKNKLLKLEHDFFIANLKKKLFFKKKKELLFLNDFMRYKLFYLKKKRKLKKHQQLLQLQNEISKQQNIETSKQVNKPKSLFISSNNKLKL